MARIRPHPLVRAALVFQRASKWTQILAVSPQCPVYVHHAHAPVLKKKKDTKLRGAVNNPVALNPCTASVPSPRAAVLQRHRSSE